MVKIDLRGQLKYLYNPSAKAVAPIEVPAMRFLMVDGTGDPNTSASFQQAMEALFSISYTAKFMAREELGIDYGVMPPEGLWWMDDMRQFDMATKDRWIWTLMIMQPDFVSADMLERAIVKAGAKKKLPALALTRCELFDEGLAAQILYIGPYSDEGPTVRSIHEYIAGCGRTLHGKHHEIYLTDMRRTAPEKWKTVIRQPMR